MKTRSRPISRQKLCMIKPRSRPISKHKAMIKNKIKTKILCNDQDQAYYYDQEQDHDQDRVQDQDSYGMHSSMIYNFRDGDKLYGRGSTDDKGPVLGWLHVIQAYQALKIDLPVNMKFCFEGMEESGSEGLDELLIARKDTEFMQKVDYVCISDNYWLGKQKPCITYGLRGICYFFIEIQCCAKDLHSGVFGGTVHEGMADLMYMMNTLLDKDGTILVDNLMDDVKPVTPEETDSYKTIDFDVHDFKNDLQTAKLINDGDKVKTLMARWRFPSLSLHGIEGAFSDTGAKTVIPRKVIGKFSIRIVPDQTPEKVEEVVVKYLNKKWAERY